MSVQYCCCICAEWGHFPANCPLPPEGRLLRPFPPAEGESLLIPSPPPPMAGAEQQELPLSLPPPPAEGECLLDPPTTEKINLLRPFPPAEGEGLLVPPPNGRSRAAGRGSMSAGPPVAARKEEAPATFAARRGGTPAAFAGRRGGAPVTFAIKRRGAGATVPLPPSPPLGEVGLLLPPSWPGAPLPPLPPEGLLPPSPPEGPLLPCHAPPGDATHLDRLGLPGA
ncbi:UNVERIFIED_CONTAM: hypothetical protein FKN15_048409 [Acipenser sinensis]